MPHAQLSQDYEQKKLYDKALQEYQRSLTLEGQAELASSIGRAYALSHWKGVLQKQIEVFQRRDTDNYDPIVVAQGYAALNDKDHAFFWLQKAYDEHAGLIFIKVEPEFDNIRSDPRYADLLRRMGLPQ